MATITNGRLVVNTINGRFGTFNVGILYSSIGDFVAKYDGLDEFNEGSYEGEFIILRIFQKTRKFRVGLIIEPVAEIGEIILNEIHEGDQDDLPPSIPDPVEEEIKESGGLSTSLDIDKSLPENLSDDGLEALFGGLWPLGDSVKLDSTVSRVSFRQQRDYLKTTGYTFISKEQIWVKC